LMVIKWLKLILKSDLHVLQAAGGYLYGNLFVFVTNHWLPARISYKRSFTSRNPLQTW
jgi:hypothetical protein